MKRKVFLILLACVIACGTGTYFLIRSRRSRLHGAEFPSWRARTWARLKRFNELIAKHPDNWKYRMWRAGAYRDLAVRPEGGWDRECIIKARQELDDAMALFPDQGELYAARARYHDDLRNLEKAIEDCTKAIDLGYRKSWVYYHRAQCRTQANEDLRESLADIETAIGLSPGMPYLHQEKARLLRILTHEEPDWSPENEAIKGAWGAYLKALLRMRSAKRRYVEERDRPYSWYVRDQLHAVSGAYVARGWQSLWDGKDFLAVLDFCIALFLDERSGRAWEGLADISRQLGIKRLALHLYYMAQRSLHSPDIYEAVANILVDDGRFARAASYYTAALEMTWDSLSRAELYLGRGKC